MSLAAHPIFMRHACRKISKEVFEELGQGVVEWELISRFFRDFCVIKVLRLIFCGKFCRLMFFLNLCSRR